MAAPAFGAVTSGTIGAIETGDGQTKTTGVTIDPTPASNPAIISAILSKPGTVNGETYSSWAMYANDGTGSADVFASTAALGSYTPAVGDDISGVSGTWFPFHQIPELETITAISANSSGNAAPGPISATIPQLNVTTLPFSIAGYMVDLDNVMISGQTAGEKFGITNLTLTVTDSLHNSMTLYYWPTSYSMANANLFGETIPNGPVDITGFDSVFPTPAPAAPEFSPISMVSVPEPVSAGLLGISSAALLMRRRRKA